MPEPYVTITRSEDLTLKSVGAEELLAQHLPEIARALREQEDGVRGDGDVVVNVKITIARREDGIRYGCGATVKIPGFVTRGTRGMLVPQHGEPDQPILRVHITDATQGTIPFEEGPEAAPATDESESGPASH